MQTSKISARSSNANYNKLIENCVAQTQTCHKLLPASALSAAMTGRPQAQLQTQTPTQTSHNVPRMQMLKYAREKGNNNCIRHVRVHMYRKTNMLYSFVIVVQLLLNVALLIVINMSPYTSVHTLIHLCMHVCVPLSAIVVIISF